MNFLSAPALVLGPLLATSAMATAAPYADYWMGGRFPAASHVRPGISVSDESENIPRWVVPVADYPSWFYRLR